MITASKEVAELMMNNRAEMSCSTSGQDRTGSALRRLFCALLLSATVLVFFHVAAAAEKDDVMFISSNIEVPIRRGASIKYKIIRIATVNDQVKLLEEKDDWSRVRFKDGGEGWLPSRFLTLDRPPAERLEGLQQEKKQLEQKIKNLNAEILTLNAEISGLKEHRSSENDELAACIKERDSARAERRAVEDTTKVIWFLAGSGALFLGWILGRMSGRPSRRRSSLSFR
jgi:SH3 domain protein